MIPHRMSLRKQVYRLMVCAPGVFLLTLGIRGRTLNTNFDFVANDPRSEQLILAYVPYVRHAETVISADHPGSADDNRRVASEWVAAAQRCRLRPLLPIAFEDTSSDGLKSQIFDAQARIGAHIVEAMSPDIQRRQYHQAAADAFLAIRLCNVLKYSDYISLFNCATMQRRALRRLEPVAGKLGYEDRETLANLLPTLDPPGATIAKMTRRSKQLFLAWRERRGYRPLSIEDTEKLSDIPALAKGDNLVASRGLLERGLASTDDRLPSYYSSLGLGMRAQARLSTEAAAFRTRLGKLEAPH